MNGNQGRADKAICPYYQNIAHNGRAILCSGYSESFSYLRVQFHDSEQRKAWSEDYCQGFLYTNCPFFQGLKEEEELYAD